MFLKAIFDFKVRHKMPQKKEKEQYVSFVPSSAADWRSWLDINHKTQTAVWLVYHKKGSGIPSVLYSDAVDEALCYGWIDSKAMSIDEKSYKQFFCKRKPKSVWSKVNKEKIERLIYEGKMQEAGLKSIAIAKENGSWNALDAVESLVLPVEMVSLFKVNKKAAQNFEAFSRSDKRNILQWISLAKKPETKMQRIQQTITLAAENRKPPQFEKK